MPIWEDKEDCLMNKEKYEHTELEIIQFQTEDVIMTSGPLDDDDSEYETPKLP